MFIVHCPLSIVHSQFLLQLRHGFVQDALVGLVSQVGYEARLLGTQHITRTADIQVLHGQVEAGTQFGKGGYRIQSSPCIGCQQFALGRYLVAVGLSIGSSYAATQLMQVAQSVVLGRVDDDGVHVGYVHAALDDGGGQQDVVVVVDKILQPGLHLVRRHLSVGDHDTCLRA